MHTFIFVLFTALAKANQRWLSEFDAQELALETALETITQNNAVEDLVERFDIEPYSDFSAK